MCCLLKPSEEFLIGLINERNERRVEVVVESADSKFDIYVAFRW